MGNVIHMETEEVRSVGRQLMYTATDYFNLIDRLRYSASNLSRDWISPRADLFSRDFEKLIQELRSQAIRLDTLGKRALREVDEWIDGDRTESAYISAVQESLSVTWDELKALGGALYMASNLRWSPLRPNSMILTGPNWMRKLLNIKEATRVIQPSTLAKGTAIVGLAISAGEAAATIYETVTGMSGQPISRIISTAGVDGAFKFSLSAVGTVGIPLALGAVAASIVGATALTGGAAVLAGGAIVLGGSAVLGFAYSKAVEAPVWQMWQASTTRQEVIETGARWVNRASNFLTDLKNRTVNGIKRAFQPPIQNLLASPAP